MRNLKPGMKILIKRKGSTFPMVVRRVSKGQVLLYDITFKLENWISLNQLSRIILD